MTICGQWVRWVSRCVGAVALAALGLFSVAGILAVWFLFNPSPALADWVAAAGRTAVVAWLVATPLKLASMRLIWGDYVWTEPRMKMTVAVLALGLVVCLLLPGRSDTPGGQRVAAAAYAGLGVVVWILLLVSGRDYHPVNPIFGSQSPAIKLFFLGMIGLFLLAGFEGVRLARARIGRRSD